MSDAPLSASAKALLEALVRTEDNAIRLARESGCNCGMPVEGDDDGRHYPYVAFNREASIGKPLNAIPWEARHEQDCPMYGQWGVGFQSFSGPL